MASIYPHLTVELDTEPFFQDLVEKIIKSHDMGIQYRKEITRRQEEMDAWFVKRGYTCGKDYFVSENGYKVKDQSIVTVFCLVFAR
jgi:hypothetical protein